MVILISDADPLGAPFDGLCHVPSNIGNEPNGFCLCSVIIWTQCTFVYIETPICRIDNANVTITLLHPSSLMSFYRLEIAS